MDPALGLFPVGFGSHMGCGVALAPCSGSCWLLLFHFPWAELPSTLCQSRFPSVGKLRHGNIFQAGCGSTAGQGLAGALGEGREVVCEQNPPFPVLPGPARSPAPSLPVSPSASRTAGQRLGPAGSRRGTELSPAAPRPSPQLMPAGNGSEGAVGSSSFAGPSLWLWEMGVGLVARSCSGSCCLLGCHREEDKKGWMGFPCFSWGLCLELAKLGWFLALPHTLLFLAVSWEEQILVSRSFSLSQPTIRQAKGFQPGKAAAASLVFQPFLLQPARDGLGSTGIPPDTPQPSWASSPVPLGAGSGRQGGSRVPAWGCPGAKNRGMEDALALQQGSSTGNALELCSSTGNALEEGSSTGDALELGTSTGDALEISGSTRNALELSSSTGNALEQGSSTRNALEQSRSTGDALELSSSTGAGYQRGRCPGCQRIPRRDHSQAAAAAWEPG